MLPISDENPTEMRPYVTVLLIALNVLVWFQVQGAGMTEAALVQSVNEYGTVPCEVTGACQVAGNYGAGALLTSMFMHGSWEHIIGNMLFLWVFGNNIEDSMGHVRFIAFYLICGLAAGAAHILFSPASQIPAVGASGAISGVMGAYIVLYPKARVRTWIPPFFLVNLNALFVLGYWFFLQLLMGAASFGAQYGEEGGVAVWAHVGGFVAGLALIKLFQNRTLVEARKHKVKLAREEVARMEWRA
ncbi:MAG TPA: rhomboid family intramembrane serine protease [Longimicrobium sp.]|nr:rhomboid family intramembrane serine protease [Longimicrobium sp.]